MAKKYVKFLGADFWNEKEKFLIDVVPNMDWLLHAPSPRFSWIFFLRLQRYLSGSLQVMGRKNVKVEWKYIPENVFQDDFWQWFLSPREVHKFSRRWVTLCAGYLLETNCNIFPKNAWLFTCNKEMECVESHDRLHHGGKHHF